MAWEGIKLCARHVEPPSHQQTRRSNDHQGHLPQGKLPTDDSDPQPRGDRTYRPSSGCAFRAQGDRREETSGGPRPDTHYVPHGDNRPPTLAL
eukprot:15705488-Heterocapsa_arctica.AAC.1